MITTKTVLVVGAGASVPYGLPTGPELLERARQLTSTHLVAKRVAEFLEVSIDDFLDLISPVRATIAPSLDAFLEHAPALDRPVRAIIAGLIHQALLDRSRSVVQPAQDWHSQLVEQLRDGVGDDPQTFGTKNSGLTIVTFNFDTLIEQRLRVAARAIFCHGGRPDLEREAGCKDFRILHVHGEVPDAAESLSVDWLNAAVDAIRLIRDGAERVNPEVVNAAQLALLQANRVAFLGFAFSNENVSRLLSGSLAIRRHLAGLNGGLFGSAFKLTGQQRAKVINRLPGIKLGSDAEDCAAMLRNQDVFVD